jgi:hypothetical protein
MNLEGEREDSAPITGEIGNLAEEIIPVEANETPQIKEITPKPVVPAPNHPYPKCPQYKQ